MCVCSWRTLVPVIIAIFYSFVCKFSETKKRYIKFEASGDYYCGSQVTGNLKRTVIFFVLHTFFDIKRVKQEEHLHNFSRTTDKSCDFFHANKEQTGVT